MKRTCLGVVLILFAAAFAQAAFILHFQSPLRDDPARADYVPHVLGAAGGGYNAVYGAGSPTRMSAEGDGWFVYTWEKTIADFQDWMGFNISLFPDTDDQNFNNNNSVAWKGPDGKAYEFKMAGMFGTDTEVWVYTAADGSYERSFIAPGSKIVWFKSPWGNKSLPLMVFGADTVLMRFQFDDVSTCGWFYGAVTPEMQARNVLGSAYFTRFNTPHMAVPGEGSVDLAQLLSVGDSVFVDGTALVPEVGTARSTLGECFDSTRVLHVYHPWRNNSTYKDSAVYITVGNNIINNPVAMERDSAYPQWFHYSFEPAVVASANWNSTMAQFNIYRKQNEWPQVTYFSEAQRPLASSLFPSGVYEAWLFTKSNGYLELSFSPLEPKTIRFLSPWDNMSPSFMVEDDTVKMGPISKDTCGWYQGTFYKHADSWDVYFKQTFGMDLYSMGGIAVNGEGLGDPVKLDSMMALYDTVWVYPFPVSTSAPRDSNEFPGKLGICPTLTISAMLLDWAGESFADSVDVDFGGIYGGNAFTTVDFAGTEYKTCGGVALGMVENVLGADGVPHRVDSLLFPWATCSAGRDIDNWFVPQVVARDAAGKEYTNATCRDIDLTLDAEGFWLADISETSPDGGFFPVDDFQYLDSAKKVPNPKFDHESGDNGMPHNYSFSMKISARFQYVRGQYFEFRGDDDVWVYIDNRLVVDIGGCHSPVEGAVDLDTMGLVEGKEYPFHIFFSERNKTGSNFKMRTSINLQTEKTYFPVEKPTSDGTIKFEILQILTEENLTCDISSVGKVDTTLAESVFILFGAQGSPIPEGGEILGPGVNYGGIDIDPTMAGFTIDTSAIVRSRTLPPGAYMLHFYLASDPAQSSQVYFEVPEYPLPDIAFADAAGEMFNPEGFNLLMEPLAVKDTLMAFVSYPVRIMVLYINQLCRDCIVTVDLSTTDSLSFFDVNGLPVTSVTTDSSGYATFNVMGYSAMNSASFTVSGAAVANKLTWGGINMIEPPVPFASRGLMFDRDGDGVADSLYVPFSEPFDEDVPDTLAWSFGDSSWHAVASSAAVRNLIRDDSTVVLTADSLLAGVFTGDGKAPYVGALHYHYTYWDEDKGDSISLSMNGTVEDRIGPVLLSAIVTPGTDKLTTLTLLLSEGTLDTNLAVEDMFGFRIWRMGEEVSSRVPPPRASRLQNGVRYDIYYYGDDDALLPTVGDSVRLMPGVLRDLSGNVPHVSNPWVRIIGGQRLLVEKVDLVTFTRERAEETALWPVVQPMVVASDVSLKEAVEATGMPGQLLNYDLQELGLTAGDSVSIDSIRIVWDVSYFSNLGQFVSSAHGVVACSDKDIFGGDCRHNPGKVFLAWNARSESGRLVGTGAYVSKLEWKVVAGGTTVGKRDDTFTLGIKRSRE